MTNFNTKINRTLSTFKNDGLRAAILEYRVNTVDDRIDSGLAALRDDRANSANSLWQAWNDACDAADHAAVRASAQALAKSDPAIAKWAKQVVKSTQLWDALPD